MQTFITGAAIIPIIYTGCKSMTNALVIIAIIMFAIFFHYRVFECDPKPKKGVEIIALLLITRGIIVSAVLYSWLYIIINILEKC